MKELYGGVLKENHLKNAKAELEIITKELKKSLLVR